MDIVSHLVRHPLRFLKWLQPSWLVLVVALVAYGLTLKASYFMDDAMFVYDPATSSGPRAWVKIAGHHIGDPLERGVCADHNRVEPMRLISALVFIVTGWLFPANPVASHAWNLFLHLCTALLVHRFGKRLMVALGWPQNEVMQNRIAFIGALIFACHPLGSEGVYYARAVMMQLISIFAFCTVVYVAEACRNFQIKTVGKAVTCAALCSMSYFPGGPIVGLLSLLMLLSALPSGSWRRLAVFLNPRGDVRKMALLVLLTILLALPISLYWIPRVKYLLALSSTAMAEHALTQGALFWEYIWRMVWPAGLCADHGKVWATGFGDAGAVTGTVLTLGIFGVALWLSLRSRRPWLRMAGLAWVMLAAPLIMRMAYPNNELMVEYRVVPSMPWVALVFGAFLAYLWNRKTWCGIAMTSVIVVAFSHLSISRGMIWQDPLAVAEDAAEQYPWHARPLGHHQMAAFAEKEYLAVLFDHIKIMQAQHLYEQMVRDKRAGHLGIQKNYSVVMDSVVRYIQVETIAKGPEAGLVVADRLIKLTSQEMPYCYKEQAPGRTYFADEVLKIRAEVERFVQQRRVEAAKNAPQSRAPQVTLTR